MAFATRAHVSRSVAGRAERGDIARIAFSDLEAMAAAVEGHLVLDFRWRGEALDRLIDERHAALVDQVVHLFEQCGWSADVEVSFSIYGERGSIDVLGRHPESGMAAVVEVKASVGDVGSTLIGLDRKVRLAPTIARERGWVCRGGVARFLVVAEGTTARDRIARHRAAFRAALPAGTRECLDWLRKPTAMAPSGILFVAPRNVRGAARRSRTTER